MVICEGDAVYDGKGRKVDEKTKTKYGDAFLGFLKKMFKVKEVKKFEKEYLDERDETTLMFPTHHLKI